jgi:hypothetical protein
MCLTTTTEKRLTQETELPLDDVAAGCLRDADGEDL